MEPCPGSGSIDSVSRLPVESPEIQHPVSARVWGAGTERGLFFFGRFELTENRTAAGTPIFQRTPQEYVGVPGLSFLS